MRNFNFENQGTHTYLVYTIGEDDAVDTMSLGMLTNNKIHGLAQTLYTQMDATKFIKYDVSAKISVKQFFTGPVNKKRLIGVFKGIVDAMLSAEEYMIDVNSILLDLDYIFADVSTCETVLVCLPIISDDLSQRDLSAFFKNIMFTTQFDQTENCDHVAKIINYLNSTPVFSLDEFKKLLDIISGMGSAPAQVQQPIIQSSQPSVQQPQGKKPILSQIMQQKQQPTVQQPPMQQPPVQQPPVQQPPMQQPPVQPIQNRQVPPMQIPQNQGNVQVPPVPQPQPGQQNAGEKKMSWFYLMQHYNSENAAAYKAQKAAQKSGQAQPVAPPAPQKQKQQPPAGFAIPGQNGAPANQGFAIPGQKPPVNQGFAIPGQNTPPVNQGFAIPGQQPKMQQPPVQQQQPKMQQPPVQQQPVKPQPIFTQPPMPQGQAMNFGETTVLGGGGGIGETTVLGATPATQVKPQLLRIKNNEKIDLNKPVFRIGKEKSYVDYFIGDNSAISRSHANIISRDGEYFVVDTNSTNHTYVNGQMLQSNVETKIVHGTKIRLGNEDFEFKLY